MNIAKKWRVCIPERANDRIGTKPCKYSNWGVRCHRLRATSIPFSGVTNVFFSFTSSLLNVTQVAVEARWGSPIGWPAEVRSECAGRSIWKACWGCTRPPLGPCHPPGGSSPSPHCGDITHYLPTWNCFRNCNIQKLHTWNSTKHFCFRIKGTQIRNAISKI